MCICMCVCVETVCRMKENLVNLQILFLAVDMGGDREIKVITYQMNYVNVHRVKRTRDKVKKKKHVHQCNPLNRETPTTNRKLPVSQ